MNHNELPDELANIRHLPTYNVPVHYFDNLADDVISKINLPVSSETPYAAPPLHYFDNLADSLLLKIKTEFLQSEMQQEAEEADLFLEGISKKNPYQVPQGYFDSFTVQIPVAQKTATVIKMHRPATWLTYAAAAIAIGIIAISIILFTGKNNSDVIYSNNYTHALSKVPDIEISDYLNNTMSDIDVLQTPDDESNVTNGQNLFKTLLNNVSDGEIKKYLNENSNGDEKYIKGI